MKRIMCTISYDGSGFSGYQVQPNNRTVQAEIELALKKIHKGEIIKVFASGRTDAGVHALGQVIHFDSNLKIDPTNWKRALNAVIAKDIYVRDATEVSDDFHARFNVYSKEYRYKVFCAKDLDIFKRHYEYHFQYELDIDKMNFEAKKLIGTHDFTSFCSAKSQITDKVRTIYEAEVSRVGDEVLFRFVGNGFLYNMVRIIVGTLMDIGRGKGVKDISWALEQKNRASTGKTAPSHGLYLWKVSYDN